MHDLAKVVPFMIDKINSISRPDLGFRNPDQTHLWDIQPDDELVQNAEKEVKEIQKSANVLLTMLSSVQPILLHPIPATKAITRTANAPEPSNSTALLPKYAKSPPKVSKTKRNFPILGSSLPGKPITKIPQAMGERKNNHNNQDNTRSVI